MKDNRLLVNVMDRPTFHKILTIYLCLSRVPILVSYQDAGLEYSAILLRLRAEPPGDMSGYGQA